MRGEYCHRYAKVAWKYDKDRQQVVLFRLRCWQWSCPYCARENRKAWRLELNKQLPRLAGQWWLMTLTARNDTRGRLESYRQLSHGIDVLLKRFKRAFGRIIYVRVFEKHPSSDALHAHFIISGLSDYVRVQQAGNGRASYTATNFRKGKRGFWALQTFAKKTSQACHMGYIADVKTIPASKSVRYVTEYMTKDAQDFDIKGLRHVATSRDVKSPRSRAKNAKILSMGHFISRMRIPPEYRLLDADTGEIIGDDYWQEWEMYPRYDDHEESQGS